jgi:hypothetical protein
MASQLGERDAGALAEAVVGGDQEENAHAGEEARTGDFIL